MSYTNDIGQTIRVGDRVVYTFYNGTWKPLVGLFLGVTHSGQVRIECETHMDLKVRRKRDGKVFPYRHGDAWIRKPHAHFIHKTTGVLIEHNAYYNLPYVERSQWEYDTKGKLDSRYEVIEVPAICTGPAGLKRTFKLDR